MAKSEPRVMHINRLAQSIVILPFKLEYLKEASCKRDVICGEGCLSKWISENAPKLHDMRPVGEAQCICQHPFKNWHSENGCEVSFCNCKYTKNDIKNDFSIVAARSDALLEACPVIPDKSLIGTTPMTENVIQLIGMWCNDCQSEVPEIEWEAHVNGHKMEREADLTRAYREEQNGPF